MSIKTSKRIALGVIASLVFAPFAAIAPASADPAQNDIFIPNSATFTNTSTTIAGRIGNSVSIAVTGTVAAANAGGGTEIHSLTIAAAFTEKPSGSSVFPTLTSGDPGNELDFVSADTGYDIDATAIATGVSDTATSSRPAQINYVDDLETTALTVGTTGATLGTITFTPAHAGTYKLIVWNDRSATGATVGATGTDEVQGSTAAYNGSDSAIIFTINVASGVSTITLTPQNTSAPEDGSYGSLIKVNIKDASGNNAALAVGEQITLDPSGTGDVATVNNSTVVSAAGAAYGLTAGDFDAGGDAWINLVNAEDEIVVLSAALSTNSAVSATTSITFREVDNTSGDWSVAPVAATTGWAANTPPAYTTPLVSSISFKLTGLDDTNFTTTEYGSVVIYDTTGDLTGKAQSYYQLTVINDGTFAIAKTFNSTNDSYKFSALAAEGNSAQGALTGAITIAARDILTSTIAVTPSLVRAALAGSVTFTATVEDNYGVAYANGRVTLALAGRNGTQATQNGSTNASGVVTFTVTDTAASTVTSVTDTVTITAYDEAGGVASATSPVITWSAVTVGTVTLGGGNNSATGVALAEPAVKDISAGSGGAEDGAVSITATVKDASGNILAGVPVSWTVSSAGTSANILSTTATTYSNTQGVATTSVYAWINGTYTVTATAGGVTATVTVDFRQTAGGSEERSISATASGRVVTATVKDRFGNPVPGVTVYATAPAGNAYLGAGSKSTSLATNVNGQSAFVVGGADATITVSTINPATVGGVGSGQTCAAATKVSCAATATALTAPTVGTVTTAETNVGNNIAAAGVATATAAITGVTPVAPVVEVVYDKPTLSFVKDGGRIILSGTAIDGEGDIIIYVKRVGTTAWKERAKTLEVAAPGDFNGSIKALKRNVVIRVKQEGTGLFSNQIIATK